MTALPAPLDADDTPMPLAEAVRRLFPFGGATVSTLRTEARKGRLAIERIAGKDFVTRKAVEEMRARCRDPENRRASNAGPNGSRTAHSAPSGSSETDSGISAQDALRERLSAPAKPSRGTSPKATGPTRRNIVPLRSSSEPS